MTAETAAALPVLAILLGMCLWAVGAATAQLRCVDAARAGARAAARGEQLATIEAVARSAAPAGAVVTVRTEGSDIRVVVGVRTVPRAGPLAHLPGLEVTGAAVAATEAFGATVP